jgi:alkyl sulfatase BDS1-like metallo-beta-lactamase superfamily hydrolase
VTVVLNREHDFVFRSIRAIFDQYLGWFSGKTSDLNRDPPISRAQNLIKLGGGAKKVFESAHRARGSGGVCGGGCTPPPNN